MSARPIRLLSTLAVASAVKELIPVFEQRTGAAVDVDYTTTKLMMERLDAGETADLVIVTDDAAKILAPDGKGRADIAVSRIGIAVADDATLPPMATLADFIAALTDTPSLSYSRAGVSGLYFAGLIERLGIAEMVNAKAVVIPNGYTSEQLMSGRVALAIQQISELLTGGASNITPIPDDVQVATLFAAVIPKSTGDADGAARLAAFLASGEAMAAYRRWGLDPAA
jgi:molybdate transport system substrate-binding protein